MLKKIINFSKKGDFKFVIYEKFSKFIGHIGISINKLIYQSRVEIVPPYEVWGLVRILIIGAGKIYLLFQIEEDQCSPYFLHVI